MKQGLSSAASTAFAVSLVLSSSLASEAQPWVARHGMTSSQYQSAFDTFTDQGYRLTHVSSYDVAGAARFAAIWEKTRGPAWVARHGMTSGQYQAEFDARVGQGYRLVLVDGYDVGGQARYAAIWEQKTGPAWVARHGMTSAQYQDEFETRVAQGYRLTWVEGYGVGAAVYYAAIFEKKAGPAWVARHGMTSAQYQAAFDDHVGDGYRLTHVSAYDSGGTDYYAAIWEKTTGPAWVARHRMTSQSYQHEFADRLLQGYRLKLVDGNAIGTSARYAAIWEAEPGSVTGSYCSGGECFDLGRMADQLEAAIGGNVKYGFEIRRGRSVIRRAQGPKRTAADAPAAAFTAFDRFNPASVSKSVTAVAMLQLLSRKNVSVDAFIHPHLPTTWSIPASVKTITFKEVLNHTSGFRGEGVGGYEYSHMEAMVEAGIDLADKVPQYENVNYALLRILVASLDGYSAWSTNPGPNTAARFITYVNEEIFAPLGIYDVAYEATGSAPTLFYPNPPGSANGTAYGNWSLRPGSAGSHLSVHELAMFGAATFKGLLLDGPTLASLKQHGLGFGDYGTLPDGSTCWGKGGYFPGSWNGGAELNSVIVSCSNGVTGMLVINGDQGAKTPFMNALNGAFVQQ